MYIILTLKSLIFYLECKRNFDLFVQKKLIKLTYLYYMVVYFTSFFFYKELQNIILFKIQIYSHMTQRY